METISLHSPLFPFNVTKDYKSFLFSFLSFHPTKRSGWKSREIIYIYIYIDWEEKWDDIKCSLYKFIIVSIYIKQIIFFLKIDVNIKKKGRKKTLNIKVEKN